MLVNVSSVRKGDIILDGRSRIEVERVEPFACSSKGTHINQRLCFERNARVQIKAGEVAREETEPGDLDEDFDPGTLV